MSARQQLRPLQAGFQEKAFGERRALGDISNTAPNGIGKTGAWSAADAQKRPRLEPCTPTPARRTRAFTVFDDGVDDASSASSASVMRGKASPPVLGHKRSCSDFGLDRGFANLRVQNSSEGFRGLSIEELRPLRTELPEVDRFHLPPEGSESFWSSIIEDGPEGTDPRTFAEAMIRGSQLHAEEDAREDLLWRGAMLPEHSIAESPTGAFRAWPSLATPPKERSFLSSPAFSPLTRDDMDLEPPLGFMDPSGRLGNPWG